MQKARVASLLFTLIDGLIERSTVREKGLSSIQMKSSRMVA